MRRAISKLHWSPTNQSLKKCMVTNVVYISNWMYYECKQSRIKDRKSNPKLYNCILQSFRRDALILNVHALILTSQYCLEFTWPKYRYVYLSQIFMVTDQCICEVQRSLNPLTMLTLFFKQKYHSSPWTPTSKIQRVKCKRNIFYVCDS